MPFRRLLALWLIAAGGAALTIALVARTGGLPWIGLFLLMAAAAARFLR